MSSLKCASVPRSVFHNKLPEVPEYTEKLQDNITLTHDIDKLGEFKFKNVLSGSLVI